MAGDRRGGSSTGERRRGIRRLLLPRGEGSSSPPPPPPPHVVAEEGRRKGFASAALRGLGCTSAAASQAYAPGAGAGAGTAAAAAVRSSADWHGQRRRRGKEKRKERGVLVGGGIGADVWCAPGIPFAAEASSVDCVVARHQMVGRGRGGEVERPHRERPCMSRRVTVQEQISSSFMDSPPPPPPPPSYLDAPFFGAELLPSGRLRRMRGYRHSPGGLEEEVNVTGHTHSTTATKRLFVCSSLPPLQVMLFLHTWPAFASMPFPT
ncbi:hypothetical protein ABZP36_025111 [Zizania latifolia]